QHERVDTQLGQSGLVTLLVRRIEQNIVVCLNVEPGILGHFLLELTSTPTCITQGHQQTVRPFAVCDILKDIARGRKRKLTELNTGAVSVTRSMQHKTPVSLYRPAVTHGQVLYWPDFKSQVKLQTLQQITQRQVGGTVDNQPQ